MFDKDLADLYSVEIKTINQAVKRNIKRFPKDFCFKLKVIDLEKDGSQSVIRERISYWKSHIPDSIH